MKTITFTIAFFAVLLIGYLFGSFVAFNFNPALWMTEARFVLAVFSLFFAIAAGCFFADSVEKNESNRVSAKTSKQSFDFVETYKYQTGDWRTRQE